MPIFQEPFQSNLQDALNSALQRAMPLISGGMAAALLILALVDSRTMTSALRGPLSLLEFAESLFFVLLWARVMWRPLPLKWAHPAYLGLLMVANGVSWAFLVLAPNPLETFAFIIFLLGTGMFVNGLRWYLAAQVLTVVCWGSAIVTYAHRIPPQPFETWWNLGQYVFEGLVLATILYGVRLRSFWQLEALAQREGQQRRELQTALAGIQEREVRLQQQNEQLLELDRQRNNFVHSVTHELRTPLTSIRGYAEFLEEHAGAPLEAERMEFVREIQKGAQRLQYLLDDLLDYARVDAGTFKLQWASSDFSTTVREVLYSLEPQAQGGRLALFASLPEKTLAIAMDAQRIEQVLLNLVQNAIKFTPAGGRIEVRAFAHEGGLRCEVRDSGPGIAAEDLGRLFERYAQLEGGVRRGGTGLGLAISKTIVEAHGGRIGVESRLDLGSTFWFELPSAPAGSLLGAETAERAGA